MHTLFVITLLAGCCLIPLNAIPQESDAQRRTQEIAASFNKQKHAVKEKHGVRIEKYKDIRSEPAAKQNAGEYSGTYEASDLGYRIDIQVGSDGKVQADGYEPGNGSARQARRFRLENARIAGALLTATKVYEDGATEKFEGVFIKRTEFSSPTSNGVSTFGLGVVGSPVDIGGVTLDRLFYQLKP